MPSDACPAVCNNRARRVWGAYRQALNEWDLAHPEFRGDPPTTPVIVFAPGEPVFCARCTALIRRCLSELDDLMSLRITMADGYQAAKRRNEQVRTSRAAPTPSPAHDDLDELVKWLNKAEGAYRRHHGWPATPRRGVNAPQLTEALSWLGSRLDAILQLPDEEFVRLFGLGVLGRYRALQEKTSTKPPIHHKPLPCPRCSRFSLYRHDDETIRCHGTDPDCGRIMTANEYSELESEADLSLVDRPRR